MSTHYEENRQAKSRCTEARTHTRTGTQTLKQKSDSYIELTATEIDKKVLRWSQRRVALNQNI